MLWFSGTCRVMLFHIYPETCLPISPIWICCKIFGKKTAETQHFKALKCYSVLQVIMSKIIEYARLRLSAPFQAKFENSASPRAGKHPTPLSIWVSTLKTKTGYNGKSWFVYYQSSSKTPSSVQYNQQFLIKLGFRGCETSTLKFNYSM